MKPVLAVNADGTDITDKIMERLVSLRISDNAGWSSDTLELVLDDRDGAITRFPPGVKLQFWFGYESPKYSLVDIGLFTTDEVSLSGPPMTMRITAKAVDMGTDLKTHRTRTWQNKTIESLVSEIAGQYNLCPYIDETLKAIAIEHEDQANESDLNFLTRLAERYGAIVKIKHSSNNTIPCDSQILYFINGDRTAGIQAGHYKKITVPATWISRYEATYSNRSSYTQVIARYYDFAAAKPQEVRWPAGNAEGPSYTLLYNYRDAYQATEAAKARFASLSRGTGTVRLTVPGNPNINAEAVLVISGVREDVDGEWFCTRVEHTLDQNGYVTTIEGESPNANGTQS